MENLNCTSVKKGDDVEGWIRKETKVGKKKRNVDDLVADVIKADARVEESKHKVNCRETQTDIAIEKDIASAVQSVSDGNTAAVYNTTTDVEDNISHIKPAITDDDDVDATIDELLIENRETAQENLEESKRAERDISHSDCNIDTNIYGSNIQINNETTEDENQNSNQQRMPNPKAKLIPRAKALPIQTCLATDDTGAPVSTSRVTTCPRHSSGDLLDDSLANVSLLTQRHLMIMMKQGNKPQVQAIQRLKNDPFNSIPAMKIMTGEDKSGSLEALMWSRHTQYTQFKKDTQRRKQKKQKIKRFGYCNVSKEGPNELRVPSRYSSYTQKGNGQQKSLSKNVPNKFSKTPVSTKKSTVNNKTMGRKTSWGNNVHDTGKKSSH